MPGKTALFKKIAPAILAAFVCGTAGHAQDTGYYFTRFTPANGLASSDINTLFQDSQHSIWIGHKAGVSRFDGHSYENLLYAGDQRIGKTNAIGEAGNTVWIAAEKGVFFYTGNRLSQFAPGTALNNVYSLTTDPLHRIWIGTAAGLACITGTDAGKFDWYKKPANCGPVKFISAPDSNHIYISDGYSIFRNGKNESELVYSTTGSRDYITGMHATGIDSIFISSQLSGLRLIRNHTIQHFNFSKGIGNALSFSNGRLLYFAVEGIYTVNTTTNNVTQLLSLPEQYREWGSSVWQDTEENIWIGTHEELLVARRQLFHHTVLPDLKGFDELYSVHQNADGSLLFGGNRGKIYRQERDQDQLVSWRSVFPLAEVFDIHTTASGDTWFCSGYQGLSLLRNGRLQRFTTQEGLRNNSNYKFLATSAGSLFVCGDNGITRIITGADGAISFKNYGQTVPSVITCMLEKKDGGLLLGGENGLSEWKNDSLFGIRLKGASPDLPSVTDIKQDASGNIWISTVGDGILVCRYEPAGGNLTLIKKIAIADGLSSMIFLQLLIDNEHTIWAAGYREVAAIRLKPGNRYLVNSFGHSHGFGDKSYHAVRMVQDSQGMIRMATSSGLISFDPVALGRSQQVPALRLNGIAFPPGKEYTDAYPGPLPPQGFALPYRFGHITFHFTGIYLSGPGTVRYAYRLLGNDSSWTHTGAGQLAVFQNLAPGNYTFQARATIDNTTWSEAVSYRFTVLAPFWQRWWFIAAVIGAITACLLIFIRIRERNIRKKEAEKTEMEKLKAISYQYQLEIEQVVNYFATVISQQKKIDELLWDVTRNCMSKLGFEDCVIYLKEDPSGILVQKAAWGPKTTDENKIINPIEILPGEGIVGAVAITGKPEIIADTRKDIRYIVDDLHRLSEITVPILSDGKVIGVIDSEHTQTNFYTERHLQILTTIAALCADKINKIKAEEKTRAKEIEVIKLNSDLVSSQLTALRSQMNPHFIFNSLNSIAQLVASMQNEKGLEYLNKFASLLRLILEESESNFISLKDEIRLLDLYLQLESLRFGSSFVYHIHADNTLDAEDTMLPSFIIHPIVENAIWHGLLHKEGERRLTIGFSKKNNEELLCIVNDNGIGVAAARAMKQQSMAPGKQQSKGLQMVFDRLHILGKEYNTPANIIIEEVKNNGFAGGTKVTIHLPVIYDL